MHKRKISKEAGNPSVEANEVRLNVTNIPSPLQVKLLYLV